MIYNWLEKKPLIRNDTPTGRKYTTPDGKEYESVTTFLARGENAGLAEWKARVGIEETAKIGKRAANRGTHLHNLVEYHLCNECFPDKLRPSTNILVDDLFKRFLPVISRIDNIRAIEYPLYSDILKLAGTVDCIAEFDGQLTVIDFKTSSNIKNKNHIDNYFLQTTIYSLMVEEMYGIKIPNIAVLIAVEYSKPQVFIENRKNWFAPLAKAIKERDSAIV